MLLEAKNLEVCYGPVKALSDSSFHVNEGEVVAMIGPNGAGKSTAIKAVAGLLDYYSGNLLSGTVLYCDDDITGFSADKLARLGVAVVPEGRRIFGSMTVSENLEMGAYALKSRRNSSTSIQSVLEIFKSLKPLLKRTAGTLSGGEQQMLAIGRALMLQPKLLITDEPSLGLSPKFVEIIGEKLKEINHEGTSVLLAEQNVALALDVSHRIYAFEIGRIILGETVETFKKRIDLNAIFLGAEE